VLTAGLSPAALPVYLGFRRNNLALSKGLLLAGGSGKNLRQAKPTP